MRDQAVGRQGARRQDLHRPADRLGRVVEGAEQGQLLVVRPPGVETDRGTGRAAAEEQHAAAASDRVHGLLPHLGPTGRIDGDLGATTVGDVANRLHDVAGARRVEPAGEAEALQAIEAPAGLADHDDPRLA